MRYSFFFLCDRDKHFKTSKEVSGVDMVEVQHFYEKISKNPKVFQEVRIWYKDMQILRSLDLCIKLANLVSA